VRQSSRDSGWLTTDEISGKEVTAAEQFMVHLQSGFLTIEYRKLPLQTAFTCSSIDGRRTEGSV
jgi:hypothetical protein